MAGEEAAARKGNSSIQMIFRDLSCLVELGKANRFLPTVSTAVKKKKSWFSSFNICFTNNKMKNLRRETAQPLS